MNHSSLNLSVFLQNPKYIKSTDINWSQFILLLFLAFAFMFVALIPIAVLNKIFNFDHIHAHKTALSMFFGAVLIAPVIEELMFRLLLKPIKQNLIIFIIITLPFSIYLCIIASYLGFTLLILFQLLILVLINTPQHYLFKTQRIFIRHFKFFYYFSIISFGFLHITNFTFEEVNVWILLCSPLLVAPQCILGAIIGFIRVKFGFTYAIGFHASYNGVLVLFTALGEFI